MRLLLATLLLLALTAPAAAIPEDELDVPYVPTPMRVVERMLDMADVGPGDYLIDLGSGDGRIAITAAQRGARALGVDIDPVRIREAATAARFAGVETRAGFRLQDLFETPLRQATVITMYLLPEVNLRLRPRILTELRPGTRVVSHNFDMGDWRPDAEAEIDASRLFFWIVPAVVGGSWSLTLADGAVLPLELDQRFQDVTGTLGGVPVEGARLSGTRFRFAAGGRTFHALVGAAAIEPDPAAPEGAEQGWIARRVE
ncbi:MAG: 50S ribosomal protein L11 methyltransferase [Pseudomonadota bacterium]|nr:50S ribosomal protein L11 methyltransferase [Pseudomonadota bacterium]